MEVANADANPSLNPGGSRHFPAVHAVWDARLCLSLADHAILAAHARGSRAFDPRLAHSGGAVRVEGPPGSCHSIAAHAVRDRRRCLSLADHATLAAHALATHASLAAHASAHAISSTAAWVPRRCPSLAIRDSRRCLSLEERDARLCLSRAVRSAHTERGSRGAERTDHAPRGSRGGAHAIADHAWVRVGVHRESVATPCHISRPTLVHRLSGRRVLKGLNSVTGRDRPQRGLRGPASSRTAILSPQYKHELLSPSGS